MSDKTPIFKTTRFVLANLRQNWFVYGRNAAFLQFFISTVGFTVLSMIFKGALVLSGQPNLTYSNYRAVLTSPLSIIAFVVYLLAVAFFIFVEFSILSFMILGTIRQTHFSWRTSVKNAFGELRQFYGLQLLYFFLYFLALLPLSGLSITSTLTEHLYVPDFITGELAKSTTGAIGMMVGFVVLLVIHFRFIYALPLQILTDDPFSKNLRHSWQLSKRRNWRLVSIFALVELVLGTVTFVVMLVLTVGVSIIANVTESTIAITTFLTLMKVVTFFAALYSKVAILAVLIKIADDHHFVSEKLVDHRREIPFKSGIITSLALIGLIANYSVDAYTEYRAQLNPTQKIVGHRGFTQYGVENSIESLEAAAAAGVDCVELDVLLTKDNQFIVMHDYNLKRLAGINKRVQDMTYDELVGLPIHQDGFTSHIPSFEEFVAKAKELNVKLLVELKPHGGEPDNYVDLFIAKMKELGIETEYKVMSLDLGVMEAIEQKDSAIDTGYVIPIQFGGFGHPNVNFYVIEDFSYNDLAVIQAQEEGHEVYVWTINEPDQLERYLRSSVTGIITDIPDEARAEQEALQSKTDTLDRVIDAVDMQLGQ